MFCLLSSPKSRLTVGGENEGFGECHRELAISGTRSPAMGILSARKCFNGDTYLQRRGIISISTEACKSVGAGVLELSTKLRNSRESYWTRELFGSARKAGEGPRMAAGKNVKDSEEFFWI